MTIASKCARPATPDAAYRLARSVADVVVEDDDASFICWFEDASWLAISWGRDEVEFGGPNQAGHNSANLL